MTFKPNLSVKEGLDHLAKRLDPIIAARFASDLGDHPWTVVLDILDQKKGFANGYKYWTYDLQAQLRMLTERLGDFGYPFDDHQRTVSTIGNELRIVRKQMAHMYEFSVDDAFRANDFCVRLLEHFGDAEGTDEAKRVRHEALAALAEQEGVPEQVAEEVSTAAAGSAAMVAEPEASGTSTHESESEQVKPDPDVLVGQPSVIGDKRLEFSPWSIVRAGSVDVLDELPKKAAKEKVRAIAVEIATYEGPIHVNRLVDKIAQSFGLQRVHARRQKKIGYQIRQVGLFIDEDKFVWPREIDASAWTEFRPNDSDADRPFIHISPVEIANAARFIRAKRSGLTDDELDVAVLQTFGRKRRTKQLAVHLARAMEQL